MTTLTEIELYKTKKGKYVCVHKFRDDLDLVKVKICDTHSEIVEFFGHTKMANEMYEELDIDCAMIAFHKIFKQ